MAPHKEGGIEFETGSFSERKRSISTCTQAEQWAGISLAPLFVGASARQLDDGAVEVGVSIHDGTYSTDFAVHRVMVENGEPIPEALKNHVHDTLMKYSTERHAKFIGSGISQSLAKLCPDMCAYLWRTLDIVTMVFKVEDRMPRCEFNSPISSPTSPMGPTDKCDGVTTIPVPEDEKADSAVRKCIMHFGPANNPMLAIGFRNKVEVDTSGRAELIHSLDEYRNTVSEQTWKCVLHFTKELKNCRVKMAFFSATPQGGGVALMRHALIRFYKLLGIDCHWYIPKPSPKVFRITKTNHNILQGVADPKARLTPEKQMQMTDWITYNANRYWLSEGGPLAEGGADVVVIDDPQMPGLIPLIRQNRPEIKIIYRSHIEIRSDLVSKKESPQAEVWDFLWENIKLADVFISHPVDKFVPLDVPSPMVGLMPACTDWLDGLNKDMGEWDLRYHHHVFRMSCQDIGMTTLCYPDRLYIAQIARFDPSKGIPDVINSYAKFRKNYSGASLPQLLVCGHGAVDDPDASIIYDETMHQLDQSEYDDIRDDVVVMRIGPSDQILNALLSTAHVVLQLSSREGFEVKVSEALHKGRPVIAARAGGIPLQVKHGRNGFVVPVGDTDAVAKHLQTLFSDEKKYKEMSEYAKKSVSDEVSTVGNAAAWMYLAAALARGERLRPNARWIADMYREEAEIPYTDAENKLPRGGIDVKGNGGA